MADHTTLALVVPLLEPHFTVYAARSPRPRASGDAPTHAVEREFADVAVGCRRDHRNGPAGPSRSTATPTAPPARSERLCAPATSTGWRFYEPAFRGAFDYPPGFLDRLARPLSPLGRRSSALELAFRERVGVSSAQHRGDANVALMGGAGGRGGGHTARLAVDATLAFDGSRYATVTTPTMLLVGERSPANQRSIVAAIDAALPDSRIVALPGQEHMAQASAPELVAGALIRFLTGASRP